MSHPHHKIHLSQRSGGATQLRETLEDALHHGFDGVELDLPELFIIFGGKIVPPALREVQACLQDYDLSYSMHAPLSLNLLDEANLDLHISVAMATIDAAAALNAKTIVLHPGWCHPDRLKKAPEDVRKSEQPPLHRIVDHAHASGIRLALENMPCLPPDKAKDLASYGQCCSAVAQQITDIASPALTACLDLSHAALSCAARNVELHSEIQQLSPHIGHLHLHDCFSRPTCIRAWTYEEGLTYGHGDTHLPLGWGDVPFASLLTNLPVATDAVVTLEIQDFLQTYTALSQNLVMARNLAKGFGTSNP